MLQPLEHRLQRRRRVAQVDDLALQGEDAVRDALVVTEELFLDLVDVVLDAVQHVAVAARDELEHRPQHTVRSLADDLGMLVELAPQLLEVDCAVRRDDDQHVVADDDVDLVAFDGLGRVVVLRRLQREVQMVAEVVELGALVGADHGCHTEWREPERIGEGLQVVAARPRQRHHEHATHRPRRRERLGQVLDDGPREPVQVENTVRHGHGLTL